MRNVAPKLSDCSLVALAFCLGCLCLPPPIHAAHPSPPLHWRWANPLPHGANILDMAIDFGIAIQVAERGQIFTSEDLTFWEPRESHTDRSLRGVTFFQDRIVISGEAGLILTADSLFDFQSIDLDTPDWLEGIAASPTTVVAVGDNGAIYSSTNAFDWTRQSTPFEHWLRGIDYGHGTFVVAGEYGLIATSTNGQEWIVRASPAENHLNRVKWIDPAFWIVGENGEVLQSTDLGTNWTHIPTGTTNILFDASGNPENHLVVGEQEVRLRPVDGDWENQIGLDQTLAPPAWTYYNAIWNDTFYFLSGRSGMMVEGFQTNSATPFLWVNRQRSVRNWLWELHRHPSLYVAVGARGTILTSTDGAAWDLELVPESARNMVLLGVTSSSNRLVAVGQNGTVLVSTNEIIDLVQTNHSNIIVTNRISTLGVFWDASPVPTTNTLQGITYAQERFWVTGEYGTLMESPDGLTWNALTSGTTNHLSSLISFPDGMVAVGQAGSLIFSPNGQNWAPVDIRIQEWIYRVRYCHNQLVAVGQNGLIMTSTNGTDWTRQTSGTTSWINDVIAFENQCFAIGNQGTLLASTNLVDWQLLNISTGKSLFGIAKNRGQLVVAGLEGAILRAEVRPSTEPLRFEDYSRRDDRNVFYLHGAPGQRFTLDRGTDLRAWATGPLFEFLDNSGTIIILDAQQENPPDREYYRANLVN